LTTDRSRRRPARMLSQRRRTRRTSVDGRPGDSHADAKLGRHAEPVASRGGRYWCPARIGRPARSAPRRPARWMWFALRRRLSIARARAAAPSRSAYQHPRYHSYCRRPRAVNWVCTRNGPECPPRPSGSCVAVAATGNSLIGRLSVVERVKLEAKTVEPATDDGASPVRLATASDRIAGLGRAGFPERDRNTGAARRNSVARRSSRAMDKPGTFTWASGSPVDC